MARKRSVATALRKTTRAALAPIGEPKRVVIAIKVKFELNAKNGLRRIVFGLEKDTAGEVVRWKIDFALFERERKADPYGDPLVSLQVEVDSKLNAKAEDTARLGLTAQQAAHALGPASDDAKDAAAGDLDEQEARGTIHATLKKR
jgi:hypothetical protein